MDLQSQSWRKHFTPSVYYAFRYYLMLSTKMHDLARHLKTEYPESETKPLNFEIDDI